MNRDSPASTHSKLQLKACILNDVPELSGDARGSHLPFEWKYKKDK
jgi:hypothetical protein